MTDPEVKNTLLDMLKEKVKLSRLFRANASMKHGVPIDPYDNGQVSVTLNPERPIQNDKPKKEIPGWIWGILGAALTALASLGIMNWTEDDGQKEPQPQINQKIESAESAFQWLEDQGEHLP